MILVLDLLLIIIYVITFIRSFFPPEKTRKILAKRKGSTFVGKKIFNGCTFTIMEFVCNWMYNIGISYLN